MTALSHRFNPMAKNVSLLEPLAVPRFYADIFYDREASVETMYKSGKKARFDVIEQFSDPDTSFRAVLMQNPQDGHGVLVFKGMEFPGYDEGAGRLGFLDDIKTIVLHKMGYHTEQGKNAVAAYDKIIASDRIETLEVVGYSMGTIFASHLAATRGAKGTNIAELGFKAGNDNEPDNITSLLLRGDLITRAGRVGDRIWNNLVLDGDRSICVPFTKACMAVPYLPGIAHDARVYASEAERRMIPAAIPATPGVS